jgi:hypothetical protein
MDHQDRGWLWVCKDQVLSSAMNSPSEPVRAWARRLLAVEAANRSTSDAQLHEAVRVSEKLRISLAQFVGADGFTALLRRALVLARADVPLLQSAKVTPEGRLEGIQAADAGTDVEAAAVITEHVLALLVVFIGESLTLRLVRQTWPDASLEEKL